MVDRMKRLSIFLISVLLLLLPVGAFGTTYYVNTSTGLNSNAGTTGVPWLDVDYAAYVAVGDDIVNIVAPATLPARNGLAPATAGTENHPVTYQGTNSSVKAYITSLWNVTHGTAGRNLFINGDVQGWSLNGINIWGWTRDITSGTITRESTTVPSGKVYSVKYVYASDYIDITQQVYLPAGTPVTLSYDHNEATAGKKIYLNVKDNTANKYLQADLATWSTNVNIAGTTSLNAWATTTYNFTTNGAGVYIFRFYAVSSGTYYLGNFSLTYANTHQWADVGGKNYKLLNNLIQPVVLSLGKSSAANWTSLGVEALVGIPKASSLANCDATQNTWWWDGTNYALYYNPVTGEDITTLHLEMGAPRRDAPTAGAGAIEVGTAINYITFNYLKTHGSQYGFYLRGTYHIVNNCEAVYGNNGNFYMTGTPSTLTDCKASRSFGEDGFHVTGASKVATIIRGWSEYSWDDGFQAAVGATLNCYYCVAYNNGLENNTASNTGFISEGTNSAFNLYNCTAYGSWGSGINDNGTGASIVRNCISWGNNVGAGAGIKQVTGDGAGLTADHNIYADQVGWTTDISDKTSDPLFVSATDFHLLPGPAVGAGINLCTAAGVPFAGCTGLYLGSTTDYAGVTTPVPGIPNPSIGAYEINFAPPVMTGSGTGTSAAAAGGDELWGFTDYSGGSFPIGIVNAQCTGPFAPPHTGTVDYIEWYSSNTGSNSSLSIALYVSSSGTNCTPTTPVGSQQYTGLGTWSAEWHRFTGLSLAVSSSSYYCACLSDGGEGGLGVITLYYKSNAPNTHYGYFAFTWNGVWGASPTFDYSDSGQLAVQIHSNY
jgi:hypothetical protein